MEEESDHMKAARTLIILKHSSLALVFKRGVHLGCLLRLGIPPDGAVFSLNASQVFLLTNKDKMYQDGRFVN